MAHFDDLAPCVYFHGRHALPRLLAVGWLEQGHDFPTGEVPAGLLPRLIAFRKSTKRPWPYLYMGGQHCWCGTPESYSHRNLFSPWDGLVYAAPEGIRHYIAAHRYRPPAEFIDAVLAAPDIESPEYAEALRACGWPEAYLEQWRPDFEPPP